MFTRHFHVEGKYLGSREEGLQYIHGELHQPQHYAYFCPECGDTWARLPVDGVTTPNWWRIMGGNCRKHPGPSRFTVPGSLLLSWDEKFGENLPDGVIRWEFERHLAILKESA